MRSALVALALALAACGAPTQNTNAPAAPPAPAPASAVAPPSEIAMQPIADTKPAPPASSAWKVNAAASTISFNGKHRTIGPFTGVFKGWSAKIVFDPNDLAHANVAVTIPTAGVTTGQQIIDEAWPETEWFDVKTYPSATFAATAFKSLGPGKYEADGALTIKGKAYPAALPFTLVINGANATAAGALTLDRTKLNIGMQSDAAGDWVDKNVTVNIKVVAAK